MRHDSFIYLTWLNETCGAPHSHLWHTANTCDTGWRKPIGCLKLQVIVCKRASNYRALLRKMTYKDKASCDSTLPGMTPVYVQWIIFLREAWLIHGIHLTHVNVWRAACIPLALCEYMWYKIHVIWRLFTCNASHCYVSQNESRLMFDSAVFICLTMIHAYVWNDSFRRVVRLIHTWDMSWHIFEWVMSHIWTLLATYE